MTNASLPTPRAARRRRALLPSGARHSDARRRQAGGRSTVSSRARVCVVCPGCGQGGSAPIRCRTWKIVRLFFRDHFVSLTAHWSALTMRLQAAAALCLSGEKRRRAQTAADCRVCRMCRAYGEDVLSSAARRALRLLLRATRIVCPWDGLLLRACYTDYWCIKLHGWPHGFSSGSFSCRMSVLVHDWIILVEGRRACKRTSVNVTMERAHRLRSSSKPLKVR